MRAPNMCVCVCILQCMHGCGVGGWVCEGAFACVGECRGATDLEKLSNADNTNEPQHFNRHCLSDRKHTAQFESRG